MFLARVFTPVVCLPPQGTETDAENVLLAYQVNKEIVQGRMPVSAEIAIELAGRIAQIEWGDATSYDDPDFMVGELMQRFMPKVTVAVLVLPLLLSFGS